MDGDSKLGQLWAKITEKLGEQGWFQQIKSKYEELDPQSRFYLKTAAGAGLALFTFFYLVSSLWQVHALKKDLNDKADLIALIQSANDEMRKLKDVTMGSSEGGEANWGGFFDTVAQKAKVDRANITLGPEKPGNSTELSKESLFDVNVKGVNIRQLVKLAYFAENSGKPLKVRNLSLDTKGEKNGSMEATLAVSAFSMKQ